MTSAAHAEEYKAPMNELNFLLNDVHDVGSHYAGLKLTGGEGATPDMVDMVLSEMRPSPRLPRIVIVTPSHHG